MLFSREGKRSLSITEVPVRRSKQRNRLACTHSLHADTKLHTNTLVPAAPTVPSRNVHHGEFWRGHESKLSFTGAPFRIRGRKQAGISIRCRTARCNHYPRGLEGPTGSRLDHCLGNLRVGDGASRGRTWIVTWAEDGGGSRWVRG